MTFSCFEFFIRLLGGYSDFTGWYGPVQFKDGLSIHKVSRFDAETLVAAGFPCMALDDDGKDQFQLVVGKIPMNLNELADLKLRTLAKEKEKPNVPDPTPHKASAPAPQSPAPEPVVPVYSRDQLEEIADTKGLKGLREAGNSLGIKGKSIPELIARILEKQGQE